MPYCKHLLTLACLHREVPQARNTDTGLLGTSRVRSSPRSDSYRHSCLLILGVTASRSLHQLNRAFRQDTKQMDGGRTNDKAVAVR